MIMMTETHKTPSHSDKNEYVTHFTKLPLDYNEYHSGLSIDYGWTSVLMDGLLY